MFRNWLFGGQPGSGKSFALRLLVLAAALDVRVEIRGYELKGVGDFAAVAPVCAEYGNGNDDDTLTACADMFGWLYGEGQKRAKRIEHYAELGKAPENKVTPELAALHGSGLHPLVVFVDEIQELFTVRQDRQGRRGDRGEVHQAVPRAGHHPAAGHPDPRQGQPADRDHPQHQHPVLPVGRRPGRQRHDPRHRRRTSSGYRATVFEPVTEAGWGILAGMGKPGARRSFYVDNDQAAKVMARADRGPRRRRGPARTRQDAPGPPGRGRAGRRGRDLARRGGRRLERDPARAADRSCGPEVYGRWEPAPADHRAWPATGSATGQIGRRIDGKTVNRRGPARADILRAVTERNRNRGGG